MYASRILFSDILSLNPFLLTQENKNLTHSNREMKRPNVQETSYAAAAFDIEIRREENHLMPSAHIKPITCPLFAKKTHYVQKVTHTHRRGVQSLTAEMPAFCWSGPSEGGEGFPSRHRDESWSSTRPPLPDLRSETLPPQASVLTSQAAHGWSQLRFNPHESPRSLSLSLGDRPQKSPPLSLTLTDVLSLHKLLPECTTSVRAQPKPIIWKQPQGSGQHNLRKGITAHLTHVAVTCSFLGTRAPPPDGVDRQGHGHRIESPERNHFMSSLCCLMAGLTKLGVTGPDPYPHSR